MREDGAEDQGRGVPTPKRFHIEGFEDLRFEDYAHESSSLEELAARGGHGPIRERWLRIRERAAEGRRQVKWRRQRAWRGWADMDWWSLDVHMCWHVGALLLAMAEGGFTCPADREPGEWKNELRSKGADLLAYDREDHERIAAAQDAWRWVADNLTSLWD